VTSKHFRIFFLKKPDQSSGDGSVLIGGAREDSLNNHCRDAGVKVFRGDTATIGGGGSKGLVETDGTD
jgi:spore coat polysaccharide biosynthesis protein SpsF (cytidylyltransferase family)